MFIVWSVLDFFIHELILGSAYEATAQLWRPMDEMKMYLIHFTVLISSIIFVYIYVQFFAKKDMVSALRYGLLVGLWIGISMGYGSYAVMPILYKIALVWFLGTLVKFTTGGLILGLTIKE
jgi:hypothetical protein